MVLLSPEPVAVARLKLSCVLPQPLHRKDTASSLEDFKPKEAYSHVWSDQEEQQRQQTSVLEESQVSNPGYAHSTEDSFRL